MLRFFYPVGQGAFYSECHDSYNVVYDCGEWKKSEKAQKLVEKSFEKGAHIKCLFISHFDFDHVCLIENLHKNFHVETCVLPVIHDNEKIILQSTYHDENYSKLENLLFDPHKFFGNNTKVLYVKMADDNDYDIEEIRYHKEKVARDPVNINNFADGDFIESGTGIGFYDWVYIPYNKKCQSRITELKNQFKKMGLDFDRYKTDLDYVKKNLDNIKKAYKNLTGTINTNSMYLYSGPKKQCAEDYEIKFSMYGGLGYWYEIGKPGCIYTGDGNLTGIKKIYKDYWKSIGTIQVPHHGSAASFNYSFLNKSKKTGEYFLFPASFGNDNIYGHPAQSVIQNIFKNNSYFIPVTENPDSFFVEFIGHK